MRRPSSSSEHPEKCTSKDNLEIVLRFYDTYIYHNYINAISFCSGSPTPHMSITFQNEADISRWACAKLFIMFKEQQYSFAALWIWLIAPLVQLVAAFQ